MTASPIDPSGELRALASDCVHCGFCLPACPTYQLWGEEMDSPRGRIHLITQILDGNPASATAASHLDRCLGCMACVPACPSGVRYDRLIEAARSWSEQPPPGPAPVPPRSLRARLARSAIFATFPYPRRLRLLTGPLRLAQRTGATRPIGRSKLANRLAPELVASLRVAPATPRGAQTASDRAVVRARPGRIAAQGPRRAVVGMLTGCVQSVFFPGVNDATARVLAAEGCEVVIPAGQGCCGALSLHTGRASEAVRFARRTIATFEAAQVDAIVVNSAGCGSAMKEYAQLLAAGHGTDGEGWADRAQRLSSKVRDLSEFLAGLDDGGAPASRDGTGPGPDGHGAGPRGAGAGPRAVRHPLPVRAVYHEACHLGYAQGVRQQPRDLLRAIPGLDLVEVGDGGTCCGSAGVYNLVQPAAAGELGARKAAAVLATGASLVISANPGCSLQIRAAMADTGAEPPALVHIAEVLDASLRGLPVTSLTGRPAGERLGPGGTGPGEPG
jgi:glycolate dehydrogenase iron-sulfur subunit